MQLLGRESVLAQLRAVVKAEGSIRAAARRLGVSASYVNGALNGRIPLGAGILAALGVERRVVYVAQKKAK